MTTGGAEPIASSSLTAAADRLADRLLVVLKDYPNRNPYFGYHYYHLHLNIEALYEYGVVRGRPDCTEHAKRLLEDGGITPSSPMPYQAQPFASLNYGMFRLTGDFRWLPVYVEETSRLRAETERTAEGAILYTSRMDPAKKALLIDFVQEYCVRLARCGQATGERSLFIDAVEQLTIHRGLLRYADTGLWSQGRGWVAGAPDALSPGAWSRGHGWLLRGMAQTLVLLPRDSEEFGAVQAMVSELVDTLLPLQDDDGMWHTLLHLPIEESCPETSGTAMIAETLGLIWRENLVDKPATKAAAERGLAALAQYVDGDGNVLSTSPGPGTLFEVDRYRRRDFPPNDPHGPFSVLFAAVESIRLGQGRI